MPANSTAGIKWFQSGGSVFLLAIGPVIALLCFILIGMDMLCLASWCESVKCCGCRRPKRNRPIQVASSRDADIPLMAMHGVRSQRSTLQMMEEERDDITASVSSGPGSSSSSSNGQSPVTPRNPRDPYDLPPSYSEALALSVGRYPIPLHSASDETRPLLRRLIDEEIEVHPMSLIENQGNYSQIDISQSTSVSDNEECMGEFKITGPLVIWSHPGFPSPGRLLYVTSNTSLTRSADNSEIAGQSNTI